MRLSSETAGLALQLLMLIQYMGMESEEKETETVLLHTCCGPCASHCIEALQSELHHVVLFYANSNIDTCAEFELRQREAERLAAIYGVELVVDPYDHASWLKAIAGFEAESERGGRCGLCFAFNLARAADYAKRRGVAGFTTSLTVSPHKVSQQIFAVGEQLDGFLPYDFKKRGGYQRSLELARKYGLYRQNYCGCEFSRRDGQG